MPDGRFSGIAILDAIPNGELNTARRLRENLEDVAAYCVEGLQVRYFRVATLHELERAIAVLGEDVKSSGLRPWLHFEGHGSRYEDGFVTADGSPCSWTQLKELITPLNIATNFNLLLVLATCFGGSFARAIRATDRAPLLGLIGPTREISIGEVEIDFAAFYETFFQTSSLKEAVSALTARASSDLYFRTTAQRFFYDIWARYKRHECTEEKIAERARRMYREAKSQKLASTPSVGRLKRSIRSAESVLFEKYRDTYFMYDLNASNRTRFPVTYQAAEKYSARLLDLRRQVRPLPQRPFRIT